MKRVIVQNKTKTLRVGWHLATKHVVSITFHVITNGLHGYQCHCSHVTVEKIGKPCNKHIVVVKCERTLITYIYFLIAVEEACPDGFEEFNSSCYCLNPNFQLNHDGAVSYCTSHDENAHLASILVSTGSSRVILRVAFVT